MGWVPGGWPPVGLQVTDRLGEACFITHGICVVLKIMGFMGQRPEVREALVTHDTG
jgi:hypothetical protein